MKVLPTIDDALGIELGEDGEQTTADATALPGTPPIGFGTTDYEAKFDLLSKLMWIQAMRGEYRNQIDLLLKNTIDEALFLDSQRSE